ncbi:hypothetical protein E2C01_066147 [Portunus trituberculatus]|uniref:Uncharacterized protein n=1 Tax=Portunus trituberculatus TaxID=210409 RepID=A0A5B7HRI7_PORTR|nr:hypothetical protein [Portunus trituberculatus]
MAGCPASQDNTLPSSSAVTLSTRWLLALHLRGSGDFSTVLSTSPAEDRCEWWICVCRRHTDACFSRLFLSLCFVVPDYPGHRHSGASAYQVLEGKRLVDPSKVPGPGEGKGHGACINGKVAW